MTRVPGDRRLRYSSGLYGELVDREERAAAAPGGVLVNVGAANYQGRPERLAAAMAGDPIDMQVAELPAHARADLDIHWTRRATVAPDDQITLSIDSGMHWLAEQGL